MPPSPIDPARLAALPADLRALFRAQEAMIEAERRRADDECSARLHVESELAASKESVERLELLVKEYERARFGKRSEKFNPDQMQLVLEDIEIAIAEVQERQDDRARRAGTAPSSRRTRRAARAFPAHLPRIEQVIEPENLECPCGCGRMVQIGEDRSRRLDVMAAQYRVIETVRPRYACAKGCTGVAQAPAPAHLVEGHPHRGAAGAGGGRQVQRAHATLSSVAGSGSAWHLHRSRRSGRLDGNGRLPPRAAGRAHERRDEAIGPLVHRRDQGACARSGPGRTKTGYLWAVLRDDRGHGGADPPIVVYHYAPGRGGDHAERILEGFDGILQVDGYQGYHRLARPKRKGGVPLRLAACWSHSRRKIIAATPKAGSPIAEAVLARIAALYAIEKEIRGADAPARQTTRNERSRPLVAELERFLREQAARLSPGSEMGKAIAYLLNHWDGLTLFLDDGCVEMDTNPVENQIRPLTLTRKNSLFAGHDEGGRSWARIASLIATCKINSVEPYVWMKATFKAIATGHPQSRIDELLPWSFGRTS
ncbi:putative transposase [Bradyrhizobium diazoefficiens]|uniref:Putative transposase n=1 Tax=Bradyrhizobium diazoefficiens TaxID=1355477 RepID=A0A0E3VTP3_9BRAD|nr:putative transposase [Bradyrhizobium diazoefficiens]